MVLTELTSLLYCCCLRLQSSMTYFIRMQKNSNTKDISMKMTSHIFMATMLFIAAFTLQTCSSSDTKPTGPDTQLNPEVLFVAPSSGAPGLLLNITGYTINPSDTGIELLVGDQPTPFTFDSSGIHALIPLFLDTAINWSVPPLTAQAVTIYKDGEVVALAKAAVTVDSLPHADGSTAMLQSDFAKLTNSLHTIYSSLPNVPGTDSRLQGYQEAVMAMLDSLVAGADSSMESILAGSSSWTNDQKPDLALTDAILASSGVLDFYNEATGSLGLLTDSLALARQQGLFCKSGGPDMDLACQMQIYVVLNDYATYFVKPTTTGYANTVGLAAGMLAIGG